MLLSSGKYRQIFYWVREAGFVSGRDPNVGGLTFWGPCDCVTRELPVPVGPMAKRETGEKGQGGKGTRIGG